MNAAASTAVAIRQLGCGASNARSRSVTMTPLAMPSPVTTLTCAGVQVTSPGCVTTATASGSCIAHESAFATSPGASLKSDVETDPAKFRARIENGLGRFGVAPGVEFARHRRPPGVAEEYSAHDHDFCNVLGEPWLKRDSRSNVGERADRDDRYLTGVCHHMLRDFHSCISGCRRSVAERSQHVFPHIPGPVRSGERGGRPSENRNVGTAEPIHEFQGEQRRAFDIGVSVDGGDEIDRDLGVCVRKRKRKAVIDV